MTTRHLYATILRPNYDCTLNGVTSKADNVTLYADRAAFEADEYRKPETALILVRRNIGGIGNYVHAEPATRPEGRHLMAGGNFVHTCDSRWKELVGHPYPISVHDRYEG